MKLKIITQAILLYFILTGLLSCDNKKLTREKAAELITTKYNLPGNETTKFRKKYLKQSQEPSGQTFIMSGYTYLHHTPNVQQAINKYVSDGLIELTDSREQKTSVTFVYYNIYTNIELTENGKSYLINSDNDNFYFKTCDIVLNEVTGIQTEGESSAHVTYTLKKTNFTPFGTPTSDDIINKKADFSLFDDGWRLSN